MVQQFSQCNTKHLRERRGGVGGGGEIHLLSSFSFPFIKQGRVKRQTWTCLLAEVILEMVTQQRVTRDGDPAGFHPPQHKGGGLISDSTIGRLAPPNPAISHRCRPLRPRQGSPNRAPATPSIKGGGLMKVRSCLGSFPLLPWKTHLHVPKEEV